MSEGLGAVLIRGALGAAARALAGGLTTAGWRVAVAGPEPAELPQNVYGIAPQREGAAAELSQAWAALGRPVDLLIHATDPERVAGDLSAAVAALHADMVALQHSTVPQRSGDRPEAKLGLLLLDAGARRPGGVTRDVAGDPEVVESALYGVLRSVAVAVAPDVRLNAIALDHHAYETDGWAGDLMRSVGFIRAAKALHGQWITLGQPGLFRTAWP